MEGSKYPLRMWFEAMFYMMVEKVGCTAADLQRKLGVKYETAWSWFTKIRKYFPLNRPKLSGTVEFDEISIGGKGKGVRGRGSTWKSNVLMAVERRGRGSGEVRMEVVANANKKAIKKFLLENIEVGTTVCTDAAKEFGDLTELGYSHDKRVMKTKEDLESHLPLIYRASRNVKRVVMSTHMGAIAPWRLLTYLHEFEFRFARKKEARRESLFEDLLRLCITQKPFTLKQIAKEGNDAEVAYSKITQEPKGRKRARQPIVPWQKVIFPLAWPNPRRWMNWEA